MHPSYETSHVGLYDPFRTEFASTSKHHFCDIFLILPIENLVSLNIKEPPRWLSMSSKVFTCLSTDLMLRAKLILHRDTRSQRDSFGSLCNEIANALAFL